MDAALADALGKPGAGAGVAFVYAPTRRASELHDDEYRQGLKRVTRLIEKISPGTSPRFSSEGP